MCPFPLKKMTRHEQRGWGNRIIGGGVQNRFYGGFYGMCSPPLSFPPPLFFSECVYVCAPSYCKNLCCEIARFGPLRHSGKGPLGWFWGSNLHPHPQPQNSLLRILRLQPRLEWKSLTKENLVGAKTAHLEAKISPRRGPPQTPWSLFGVYVFSFFFPWKQQLFGIHKTSFLPVEELEFSELKAPLVYTLTFLDVAPLEALRSAVLVSLVPNPPELHSPDWVGSKGSCPQQGRYKFGCVCSRNLYARSWRGNDRPYRNRHTQICTFLAGDDRPLTLLGRGCANSVVGLELVDCGAREGGPPNSAVTIPAWPCTSKLEMLRQLRRCTPDSFATRLQALDQCFCRPPRTS